MKYVKYKYILRNGRIFRSPEREIKSASVQIGGIYSTPGEEPVCFAWATDNLDVNSFSDFDMQELTLEQIITELQAYDPDARASENGMIDLPNICSRVEAP